MLRLLLLLLFFLGSCSGLLSNEGNPPENRLGTANILRQTFNSPDCVNPCWLGIELGVTDRTTTKRILQEHGIDYTLEGYTGDSIWLHHIPDGLFPDVAPGKFTRGGINIGEDGTVVLMSFEIDLCVSTAIEAYGPPANWPLVEASPGILVYLDHLLFFGLDHLTQRMDGVYLHLKDTMPLPEDLEDWSQYADVFSGECTDVFSQ
jgi:hypothetical protein